MNHDVILCTCSSPEHQVLISQDPEDKEVYLSIHLSYNQPWYRRLWTALRYVAGYRSRYGHWDCVVLNESHTDQIYRVANHLEKMKVY